MREAAIARRDETTPGAWLDDAPVAATLTYFAPSPVPGDVDNIVKPILDALAGVAYRDDELVEQVIVRKVVPDLGWAITASSDKMTEAIYAEPPLVHIRIDADLGWRNVQ